MLNADLFRDLEVGTPVGGPAAAQGTEPTRSARAPRPIAGPPTAGPSAAGRRRRTPGGDPHFRLAMKVARRIGRLERRDQAGHLICHHLRLMLDAPG